MLSTYYGYRNIGICSFLCRPTALELELYRTFCLHSFFFFSIIISEKQKRSSRFPRYYRAYVAFEVFSFTYASIYNFFDQSSTIVRSPDETYYIWTSLKDAIPAAARGSSAFPFSVVPSYQFHGRNKFYFFSC